MEDGQGENRKQEAFPVESERSSLRGSRCHNYGKVKTLKTGGAPSPVDKACHPAYVTPGRTGVLQGHPQQSVLSGMVRLSPTEVVVNKEKDRGMLWYVPAISALKRSASAGDSEFKTSLGHIVGKSWANQGYLERTTGTLIKK